MASIIPETSRRLVFKDEETFILIFVLYLNWLIFGDEKQGWLPQALRNAFWVCRNRFSGLTAKERAFNNLPVLSADFADFADFLEKICVNLRNLRIVNVLNNARS